MNLRRHRRSSLRRLAISRFPDKRPIGVPMSLHRREIVQMRRHPTIGARHDDRTHLPLRPSHLPRPPLATRNLPILPATETHRIPLRQSRMRSSSGRQRNALRRSRHRCPHGGRHPRCARRNRPSSRGGCATTATTINSRSDAPYGIVVAGYEPKIVTMSARVRSRSSAPATIGSSRCPSNSIRKKYSPMRTLCGRLSI